MSFFFFQIATFTNQMEFRCSVEGEEWVVVEKIDSDFWRVGSEKEGEVVGLQGEVGITGGVLGFVRGGKSIRDVKVGTI